MADEDGIEQATEPTYALTLDGNGVTIKRDVPESVARAITAIVMGGAPIVVSPQAGGPAGSPGATPTSPGGRQSVREYLNEVGPKRNAEKITAIVAYLKEQGQETVTRDQVKENFRKAGEAAPGNYHRDFTDALATGWIAEDHANSGNYYLTSTGEAAIENGFPGKIRRPARKKSRRANGNDET
jgi:hypothetical protein